MEKPQIDFSKPPIFLNALEHYALALAHVMVAMRDEASFREEPDQALVNAAHLFCSMLEDAHREAMMLADRLEARASKSSFRA